MIVTLITVNASLQGQARTYASATEAGSDEGRGDCKRGDGKPVRKLTSVGRPRAKTLGVA